MRSYLEPSVKYMINSNNRENEISAGKALLYRGITSLILESILDEASREILTDIFNHHLENVRTPTDILVFLLTMEDSDVTGEIANHQPLFEKGVIFEGLRDKLFDILKKTDANKRSFPQVSNSKKNSRTYFIYDLSLSSFNQNFAYFIIFFWVSLFEIQPCFNQHNYINYLVSSIFHYHNTVLLESER